MLFIFNVVRINGNCILVYKSLQKNLLTNEINSNSIKLIYCDNKVPKFEKKFILVLDKIHFKQSLQLESIQFV